MNLLFAIRMAHSRFKGLQIALSVQKMLVYEVQNAPNIVLGQIVQVVLHRIREHLLDT